MTANSSVAGSRSAIRLADRLRQAVADAEIAMQRGPQEAAVLHEERLVEAKLLDQREPLRLGVVLPEQDVDRVADVVEQGEGDEADDKQDRNSLEEAGKDEAEHGAVTYRQPS